MNLFELLKKIGELGKAQKLINYSAAGGSIAQLNPLQIDWYPVLFLSPSGSHEVKENTTRFEITLFYLDRLLEDDSNDIDIYSSSIANIQNLMNGIKDIPGVVGIEDTYLIRNFTEPDKLNDRVSGAYAQVKIEVSNSTVCFVEPESLE